MNFKLVEDFLSLATSQNFSRSAEERNVTQPAFSRRIQQLEVWVGVPLVDRSTYPTKLTEAGMRFRDAAEESLSLIHDVRNELRDESKLNSNTINFATPYTISTYYFPKWLTKLKSELGELSIRLILNFTHNHVETLVNGNCDFLICHHHSQLPRRLDQNIYSFKILGSEKLIPVSAVRNDGKPKYCLDDNEQKVIPHLSYSSESYLGKVETNFLEHNKHKPLLNRIYESPMSESIKKMAVEGHGLAWLPLCSLEESFDKNILARAGNQTWDIGLEVRIYRSLENQSDKIEKLWKFLPERNASQI